jgi:hypothetical protein
MTALDHFDENRRRLTKAEREAVAETKLQRLQNGLLTRLAGEKAADINWLAGRIIDELDDLVDYAERKTGGSDLRAKINFGVLQEAANGCARVQRQHTRDMER